MSAQDVYKRQEYGLQCMGIAENGFRELTNSVREVKSVDDMKNLKVRVAGSNLLMECYKRWGADATNLNWSETYTALQQNTVEGEENPLPAIDAASVQEVQPYCSMWDAVSYTHLDVYKRQGDLPSGREAPGGRLPRGSGKVWRFL